MLLFLFTFGFLTLLALLLLLLHHAGDLVVDRSQTLFLFGESGLKVASVALEAGDEAVGVVALGDEYGLIRIERGEYGGALRLQAGKLVALRLDLGAYALDLGYAAFAPVGKLTEIAEPAVGCVECIG
ncbi:MAG: hypothetical protein K2J17_06675 [Paramuribaculum sp.]|nr:hypothetical protein [Paramuribaculum sp.]